jgi:hypothetical protein
MNAQDLHRRAAAAAGRPALNNALFVTRTRKQPIHFMKDFRPLMVTMVAATACAVITGCEGISGTPYRTNTAAAAILGDRPRDVGGESAPKAATGEGAVAADGKDTNARSQTNAPIVVPVEAEDVESRRYLSFSPVQVHLEGVGDERTVRVYTDVQPQCLTWRVSLIKNGKAYYNFVASSQSHLTGQVISLQPLALEPNLPVPDKVVVTLVK